jgi:hypothetical protein
MKEEKTLEAFVKRCQGEWYIGIVRPVRANVENIFSKNGLTRL